MSALKYKDQQLFIEDVSLAQIAKEFDTPCYVYSKQVLLENWHAYYDPLQNSGCDFRINYAVKANSNLSILKLLAQNGASFDVVSGGEIERVIAAGGDANSIVFAGVGKSVAEIKLALDLDIYSFHVESDAELLRINELAAKKNKIANIALRINPDITGDSHPYITTGSKNNKFGIAYTAALDLYLTAQALSNVRIIGISSHIGSQITTMEPFLLAIDQLLVIIKELQNKSIPLEYIDIGGGLGIRYKDETPPTPQEYIAAILAKLQSTGLEIHIEPGRSIVAKAGLLLTKIEYIKTTVDNNFAIVDAAMNDLMRPALYQSYHEIVAVQLKSNMEQQNYSIVGPICESGDFIGTKRSLSINSSDLLAIKDCGAYGFSMSSNYNTRPRCAEVLVDGSKTQLIRKRETIKQLLQNEE